MVQITHHEPYVAQHITACRDFIGSRNVFSHQLITRSYRKLWKDFQAGTEQLLQELYLVLEQLP